ncbi:MAG: TetR/AcrR family transcriptional regulator [Chloroflexi bacterium]|nr:TetR/AcrR family transcriptional regulator [Chloroflexota bacterium]
MPDQKATTRLPLSRERVLRAAIALADLRGLDALSMRKLGQELGVEAMSLYNHVASKEDLLDGITDAAIGEIELPVLGVDWKAAMRQSGISAHRVLRRHPWACALWTRQAPGPARLRYMDTVFACLRQGGFAIEPTYAAYHVLDFYIVGFTTQQVSFPPGPELQQLATGLLATLAAGDYPYLAEHVRQHIEGGEHIDSFEFGLDFILDGLSRVRDQG